MITKVRRLLIGLVMASSILAHGLWRAGHRLHHVFGAALVALVTIVLLPRALAGWIRRTLAKT